MNLPRPWSGFRPMRSANSCPGRGRAIKQPTARHSLSRKMTVRVCLEARPMGRHTIVLIDCRPRIALLTTPVGAGLAEFCRRRNASGQPSPGASPTYHHCCWRGLVANARPVSDRGVHKSAQQTDLGSHQPRLPDCDGARFVRRLGVANSALQADRWSGQWLSIRISGPGIRPLPCGKCA